VSDRSYREARVVEIGKDQARIRENMDRLSQSSDLYKRYVKTLTEEEDELAKLREEIAKLRDQESAQRKEVNAFILSVEAG